MKTKISIRLVTTRSSYVLGFLALLLLARTSSAQQAIQSSPSSNSSATASAHDRLVQLYTSTSTPAHYARAIQNLLQNQTQPSTAQNSAAPEFGTDGLTPQAAADLSGVRVYPNPYKPNGGDPNHGVAFTPGNPTSGIVFDTLTPSAEIKIYTVSGQLVRTLGPPNASGALQWDAKNDEGRDAASGLYMAVITSPGVSKAVKKVVIVR
ncbi:MAG: T9SS type A sorting domain-containing protein [Elusimicrobiota bacterium]